MKYHDTSINFYIFVGFLKLGNCTKNLPNSIYRYNSRYHVEESPNILARNICSSKQRRLIPLIIHFHVRKSRKCHHCYAPQTNHYCCVNSYHNPFCNKKILSCKSRWINLAYHCTFKILNSKYPRLNCAYTPEVGICESSILTHAKYFAAAW